MQERFKQLLEEKNLTATRFAALIKVNASAMSHILNGRSKPGFDVLDKIAQAFPEVNLNWLISGKGSMYNNSTVPEGSAADALNHELKEKKRIVEPRKAIPVLPLENISPDEIPATGGHVKQKKIKRIILFFEDGSFEDFEK